MFNYQCFPTRGKARKIMNNFLYLQKLLNFIVVKINLFLSLAVLFTVFSSCGGNSQKTDLFNGSDLAGWEWVGNPDSEVPASEICSVVDGNIRIAGRPFGYLRTAEKYGDVKLHAEWRWVGEGTNSGLFIRVQDEDKLWPNAIECQLCNGKAGDLVMLGGSKIQEVECVEAFPVKDRAGDFENPVGEWNVAEVICEGNRLTIYINGNLQNECTCDSTEGYIAFQSEGGPIEFRNVYIEK